MQRAISETDRRRSIQQIYNEANGITPQSIVKPIDMSLVAIAESDNVTVPLDEEDDQAAVLTPEQRDQLRAPFLPDIELLEQVTGESFDQWRHHRDGDSFQSRKQGVTGAEVTATG